MDGYPGRGAAGLLDAAEVDELRNLRRRVDVRIEGMIGHVAAAFEANRKRSARVRVRIGRRRAWRGRVGQHIAERDSKFKAVNNRDKNFTEAKMKRRLEQIDESIARYLSQLDTADRQGPTVPEAKTTRLKEKIAKCARK
jgi:hypothetical protein